MAIYRGVGGAGDISSGITLNEVTELTLRAEEAAVEAEASATAAEAAEAGVAADATAAASSATNAASSATNSQASATAAATSESNAATSATNAATSATTASTAATTATDAIVTTGANATAAATSATNAATSATTATTKASEASTSASNAATSATAAAASESSAAADAATATSAATSATASASTASTAATSATNSANTATTAATTATTQATNASNSATAANNSQTASAASESAAATSAANAATSESNAATSETNAATSATNSANSATASATSETNSASSATAAAASYDAFDDRYLGSKASAPTLDNDGNALLTGALYWDTTAEQMRVYTGSSWVATAAAVNGTYNRQVYTATASQTTFTITYDVGFVDVYLNGVKLIVGTDFTATSGTNIVLATGATAGDLVDIVAYGAFEVADTYSQAAADARFATTAQGALADSAQPALVSGTNIKTVNSASLLGSGDIVVSYGLFRKADPTIVAWSKTSAFTVSTATTFYIEVNGALHTIASSTAVTMPGSATTGTDYAIWAKTDGTLEATTNHTSPPTANARKVGGFHYAAGGNSTGTSGGDTTPQINEYSFWDLKWRPSCADPRGMTLVGGGFWMDIYLTGADAITNGSSKYNVTIAAGASPPKIPTMFGGDGSTTYGFYTWFEAMELATAFGKQCPTQQEFMSAMYGTTENSSLVAEEVSTILNEAYTSKWGVMQSTGVKRVWSRDRGGAYNTGGYASTPLSRGLEYNAPYAGLLGGRWALTTASGSRSSEWQYSALTSFTSIGSRFSCSHHQAD